LRHNPTRSAWEGFYVMSSGSSSRGRECERRSITRTVHVYQGGNMTRERPRSRQVGSFSATGARVHARNLNLRISPFYVARRCTLLSSSSSLLLSLSLSLVFVKTSSLSSLKSRIAVRITGRSRFAVPFREKCSLTSQGAKVRRTYLAVRTQSWIWEINLPLIESGRKLPSPRRLSSPRKL